jgi:hypothetical protein
MVFPPEPLTTVIPTLAASRRRALMNTMNLQQTLPELRCDSGI